MSTCYSREFMHAMLAIYFAGEKENVLLLNVTFHIYTVYGTSITVALASTATQAA